MEVGRGGSVDSLVGQYHRLEIDRSCYREPVEVAEEMRGHVGELRQVVHESRCRVLDALQRLDRRGRESSQERVAVVEVGDDECLDQELCCFPREEGLNPADVVESKSAGSGHRGGVGCAAHLVIQYDAEVPCSW